MRILQSLTGRSSEFYHDATYIHVPRGKGMGGGGGVRKIFRGSQCFKGKLRGDQ